jgi:hypothetical protein
LAKRQKRGRSELRHLATYISKVVSSQIRVAIFVKITRETLLGLRLKRPFGLYDRR